MPRHTGLLPDRIEKMSRVVDAMTYSMESPYALACACALPDRVSGITLVGGLAPNLFDPAVTSTISSCSNTLFAIARDNPLVLLDTLKTLASDGESLHAAMATGLFANCKQLIIFNYILFACLRDCAETLSRGAGCCCIRFHPCSR